METKTFNVNIPEDEKDSAGYIMKASKEIASNPDHKYSVEEVSRIQGIENQMKIHSSIASSAVSAVAAHTERMEKIGKLILEMDQRLFGGLANLTTLGWYLSPNIVGRFYVDELEELVRAENINKFEQGIIDESDLQIPRIVKNCGKLFPQRAHIFNEMLALYNSKHYYSLITLAYAQADGICKDIWGKFGFFDKDKDKDNSYKMKLYLKLSEKDLPVISSILVEQMSVTSNELTIYSKAALFGDSDVEKRTFNRHKIVHGHSINYGTKVNAIRAMYLLDYLTYLIDEFQSDLKGEE
jgi:hypothetical protein